MTRCGSEFPHPPHEWGIESDTPGEPDMFACAGARIGGFMILVSIEAKTTAQAITEEHARVRLDHEHPGIEPAVQQWLFRDATPWRDDDGELFEVPAHWVLCTERIIHGE